MNSPILNTGSPESSKEIDFGIPCRKKSLVIHKRIICGPSFGDGFFPKELTMRNNLYG